MSLHSSSFFCIRLGAILLPEVLTVLPLDSLESGAMTLEQLPADQLTLLHRCLVLGALVFQDQSEGKLQLAIAASMRSRFNLPIIG